MSEHKIGLEWKRESERFTYDTYNRDHAVIFEGGARIPLSAAPAYRGNAALVNPEEALVAALSSCHMLTLSGRRSQEAPGRGSLQRSGRGIPREE